MAAVPLTLATAAKLAGGIGAIGGVGVALANLPKCKKTEPGDVIPLIDNFIRDDAFEACIDIRKKFLDLEAQNKLSKLEAQMKLKPQVAPEPLSQTGPFAPLEPVSPTGPALGQTNEDESKKQEPTPIEEFTTLFSDFNIQANFDFPNRYDGFSLDGNNPIDSFYCEPDRLFIPSEDGNPNNGINFSINCVCEPKDKRRGKINLRQELLDVADRINETGISFDDYKKIQNDIFIPGEDRRIQILPDISREGLLDYLKDLTFQTIGVSLLNSIKQGKFDTREDQERIGERIRGLCNTADLNCYKNINGTDIYLLKLYGNPEYIKFTRFIGGDAEKPQTPPVSPQAKGSTPSPMGGGGAADIL